ncbi:MAG: PilZ domain-containing protein [Alteraurantiacibacter sp.]
MPHRALAKLVRKLQVKCRFKAGNTVDLDLLDLSPGGCLVDIKRWGGEVGERVLVKLPGLAFQPASIAWVDEEQAGIAFEQAMHEAVLDHLLASAGGPQPA